MRVLFAALHFTYFRNYESVLRDLAERGHQVHVVADETEDMGGQQLVERLAAQYPNLTWSFAPPLEAWSWTLLARRVRYSLEYIRFQDPTYDATPKYRHRAAERGPRLLRWMCETAGLNQPAIRRGVAALLDVVERGIPTCPALDRFLEKARPDVVVLASVTNPGALQMDHLKSAMAHGRRTAISVWSWDHLTGKAWLRIAPDRVLLWNAVQRREAEQLHGLPSDRIVETGAQCYDQWFDRMPSRDRETFCRDIGLRPDRPIVLYACSVLPRTTYSEAEFVVDWVRRIRASDDGLLRTAGLLIRPHPERLYEWDDIDLSGFDNVALRGRNPVDAEAKADYFDSLFHSAAVAGLVTSAFVEAAVVGRPVFAMQPDVFRVHQEGTPHFGYLRRSATGEGLLDTATTFDEHLRQLAASLANPGAGLARTRRFVEQFVRPQGLGVPSTPRFVDALAALAAQPAPAPAPFGAPAARLVAGAAALAFRLPGVRVALMSVKDSEDEVASIARASRDRAAKAQIRLEVQARVDAKERTKAAKLQGKGSVRREKEQSKQERVQDRDRRRARERRARIRERVKQLLGMGPGLKGG
jgi:hypothetical protein